MTKKYRATVKHKLPVRFVALKLRTKAFSSDAKITTKDMPCTRSTWLPIWTKTITSVSCVRVAFVWHSSFRQRWTIPSPWSPMPSSKTWSKWIARETSFSTLKYEHGGDREFSETSTRAQFRRRVQHWHPARSSASAGVQYRYFGWTRSTLGLHLCGTRTRRIFRLFRSSTRRKVRTLYGASLLVVDV